MKDGYLRFCLVTEAGLVSHPQSDVSASFPRSSMFRCRSDMIKVSGHRRQILLKEENHGVGVFFFLIFLLVYFDLSRLPGWITPRRGGKN